MAFRPTELCLLQPKLNANYANRAATEFVAAVHEWTRPHR